MAKFNAAETPEIGQLGRNLLRARTRQGLTQEELAKRAGLSTSDVSKIEYQRRWPTLPQLIRLARALAVPLQWFLTGDCQPGTDLRDYALELEQWGVADLFVPDARVPGAFRPVEEILALVLGGDRPDPRLVEAIPAVLAWNSLNVRLLLACTRTADRKAVHRLAWLADVALTIHHNKGFPGGCPSEKKLAALVKRVQRPEQPDDLGYPGDADQIPPVSRRWKITCPISLEAFRARAERLHERIRQKSERRPTRGRRADAPAHS